MEDSLLRELQGSSPSIVLLHEGCVLIKDLLGKDEPPRDVAERDLVVLCMQSLLIILQSGEINQTPIEFYKKFVISVEKKCPWSFNEVEEAKRGWRALLKLTSLPAPPVLLALSAPAPSARLPLLPLVLLLLSTPPPETSSLLQAVFASPHESRRLLQLLEACPCLVDCVVKEMSGVLGASASGCSHAKAALGDALTPEQQQQRRFYTCLLAQLCCDCAAPSAAVTGLRTVRAVRKSLSALRLAPQLCLHLSQTHLLDTPHFLADVLQGHAGDLRVHWLFSALSAQQSSDLAGCVLSSMAEEIMEWQNCLQTQETPLLRDRCADFVGRTRRYLRMCCALLRAGSDASSPAAPLPALAPLRSLGVAVQALSLSAPSLVQSQSPYKHVRRADLCWTVFHIRALACAVHVVFFARCACAWNQGQTATPGSATAAEASNADVVGEELAAILDQVAGLLISPFLETWDCGDDIASADFSQFCYHLRLGVSLSSEEGAPLLQEVAARLLGLAPEDALPRSALPALAAALQCFLPRCPSAARLLLQREERLLVREFFALPLPARISRDSEYPGDWLCTLCALLKSSCARFVVTYVPAGYDASAPLSGVSVRLAASAQRVAGSLLLHVLRQASPPLHSHLHPVIDLWLLRTRKRAAAPPLCLDDILELIAPLAGGAAAGAWCSLSVMCTSRGGIEARALAGCSSRREGTGVIEQGPDVCELRTEAGATMSAVVDAEQLTHLAEVQLNLVAEADAGAVCVSSRSSSSLFHSADAFRAAVACYASLKHAATCCHGVLGASSFIVDPRDLPLKPALALLLHARVTARLPPPKPAVQQRAHSDIEEFSRLRRDASAVSFMSSFVRLVQQFSPEILIRERAVPIAAIVAAAAAAAVRASAGREVELKFTAPELFDTPNSTEELVAVVRSDLSSRPPQLLASLLLLATSTNTCERRVLDAVLALLREEVASCQSRHALRKRGMCAGAVLQLWMGVHALLSCPSRLELATVSLFLELGRVHRPRHVSSYATLVQEPLVLLRLPLALLRLPLVFCLVQFMHRSLTVAAESAVRGALQPRRGVVAGLSAEEAQEFLSLQAVIAVRALLELWLEVRRLPSPGTASDEAVAKGLVSTTVEQDRENTDLIASDIRDMLATLLSEKPVLRAVLHLGVPKWPAFRLLALASDCVLGEIAEHTYSVLSLSLSSEVSSPLSASSAALPNWLWHVIFLLKLRRTQPLLPPDNVANRWICKLAESLFAFFKCSVTYSWWSTVPLVGRGGRDDRLEACSLGGACLALLGELGGRFPAETLKIAKFFAAPEVPASHVFSTLQEELAHLQEAVLARSIVSAGADGATARAVDWWGEEEASTGETRKRARATLPDDADHQIRSRFR